MNCSLAWQRRRNNILLRHVPHLSAECVGVTNRIQSAYRDRSGRGGDKAKKRSHKRGFPCAAGPKHTDKFAWSNCERYAVKKLFFSIAILYRHTEPLGHNGQSMHVVIHFFLASSTNCG